MTSNHKFLSTDILLEILSHINIMNSINQNQSVLESTGCYTHFHHNSWSKGAFIATAQYPMQLQGNTHLL